VSNNAARLHQTCASRAPVCALPRLAATRLRGRFGQSSLPWCRPIAWEVVRVRGTGYGEQLDRGTRWDPTRWTGVATTSGSAPHATHAPSVGGTRVRPTIGRDAAVTRPPRGPSRAARYPPTVRRRRSPRMSANPQGPSSDGLPTNARMARLCVRTKTN